jgi:hypothetical protein
VVGDWTRDREEDVIAEEVELRLRFGRGSHEGAADTAAEPMQLHRQASLATTGRRRRRIAMPRKQRLDRAEVLKALSTVGWITVPELVAGHEFPAFGTGRALKELENTGLAESRRRAMPPGTRGQGKTEWRRVAEGEKPAVRRPKAAALRKAKPAGRRRPPLPVQVMPPSPPAPSPATDRITVGVPRLVSADHLQRLAVLAEAAATALNLGSEDPCVELVVVP